MGATAKGGQVISLPSRPEWHERANCRGVDPSLFFTDQGATDIGRDARRVCAGCVVRVECLRWAVDNCEVGIWGGTSPKERQRMRAGRDVGLQVERPIAHGTAAGYMAHRRRGEAPCVPCTKAHTAYGAARRQAS